MRHRTQLEEMQRKHNGQLHNLHDDVTKLQFQQRKLLVEIQDLKSYKEQLLAKEVEHARIVAQKEDEKQELREMIVRRDNEIKRERDRADKELLQKNEARSQIEKDARAFRSQTQR
eukprot:TRINITY_DN3964_c0_g1_i8.p2 TRINITY_DN3964_c0_g1~~TRINITY_DN3964_c0_g1_i8.p2  ORF type:complete len:116 (-),score=31.05 TRINITY_DN3964_c0_g1_i8:239-586(-)